MSGDPFKYACCAKELDIEIGRDGKLYIAIDLEWIRIDESWEKNYGGLPVKPCCSDDLGVWTIGTNGKEYMCDYVDNHWVWVVLDDDEPQKAKKKDAKAKKPYPSKPAGKASLGDLEKGRDGKMYIACLVNNKMSWVLTNK
jgi:hypothetical protein